MLGFCSVATIPLPDGMGAAVADSNAGRLVMPITWATIRTEETLPPR